MSARDKKLYEDAVERTEIFARTKYNAQGKKNRQKSASFQWVSVDSQILARI